ncbi:hypothetical protein ACMGE9_07790 [Macrococcus sp. EM39E]|uniref:hypothetical protein n=1 Tax=Macrococcus animalis TaxID=3395467 RepID=UPI0039BE7063
MWRKSLILLLFCISTIIIYLDIKYELISNLTRILFIEFLLLSAISYLLIEEINDSKISKIISKMNIPVLFVIYSTFLITICFIATFIINDFGAEASFINGLLAMLLLFIGTFSTQFILSEIVKRFISRDKYNIFSFALIATIFLIMIIIESF